MKPDNSRAALRLGEKFFKIFGSKTVAEKAKAKNAVFTNE